MVIDDVERPEAATVVERIAHEVRRPDDVRPIRSPQRPRLPNWDTALRAPAMVEPELAVHAVRSLVIPSLTRAPQYLVILPEATPRILVRQRLQRLDYLPVAAHPIDTIGRAHV